MIEGNIQALRDAVSESIGFLQRIDNHLKGYQQASSYVTLTNAQKNSAITGLTALKTDSDTKYDVLDVVIQAEDPI